MGFDEDTAWLECSPGHLWIFDKLILSRKLGYLCGPVGVNVPHPGDYIVRPCVNLMGMGQGAEIVPLEESTDHLPLGHFWCEVFYGRHLSVDYSSGEQVACFVGFRDPDAPIYRWSRWERVGDEIPHPRIIDPLPYLNCEYIGGKLIEAHLRHNPDRRHGSDVLIPVWKDQETTPPEGMKYMADPDHHRIGFFVLDTAAPIG